MDRLSASLTHAATVDRGRQSRIGHRRAIVSGLRHYRRRIPLGGRPGPSHRAAAHGAVPVTSHAPWVRALQGITLPDVVVQCRSSVVDAADIPPAHEADRNVCSAVLASRRGALLFTHFGVSGPAVMDVSHAVSGIPRPDTLVLRCDLLPEVSEDELDALLARECTAGGKKHAAALLGSLAAASRGRNAALS